MAACRRCEKNEATEGHNYCAECHDLYLEERGVNCLACGKKFIRQSPKHYMCFDCSESLWDGKRLFHDGKIAEITKLIERLKAQVDPDRFETILTAMEVGHLNEAMARVVFIDREVRLSAQCDRLSERTLRLPVHLQNDKSKAVEQARWSISGGRLDIAHDLLGDLEERVREAESAVRKIAEEKRRRAAANRLRAELGLISQLDNGNGEGTHSDKAKAETAAAVERLFTPKEEEVLV